jgi:hypothetical protein
MQRLLSLYPYRALDNSRNEIRVLRICPNVYEADIECHMTHISLDGESLPEYYALSYTWGDAS